MSQPRQHDDRKRQQVNILSVTELTGEIRFNLSCSFPAVFVTGEISGLSRPSSGHLYFTLKDKTAQISCIIWRGNAQRLKFELENGMEIICGGGVDVYPQRGNYQLIVNAIQRAGGEGALQRELKRLQAKLESEGLFDPSHKKRLPPFPRRVVVITSPSGAAVKDFLQILNRRWPNIDVTIIPVRVQGDGSATEIANAIHAVDQFAELPDVVVVTRGGGSIEDLWSFNEEIVCRAIYDCPVPVISGVGHEIDVTLADRVADVRALTPSEAAERLVPDQADILNEVDRLRNRMRLAVVAKHQSATLQLESLVNKTVLRQPLNQIRLASQELDRLESKLQTAIQQKTTRCQHDVREQAGRLESINPLSVLARGYSLSSDQAGNLLTDCKSVSVGDKMTTRLAGGIIVSTIDETTDQG